MLLEDAGGNNAGQAIKALAVVRGMAIEKKPPMRGGPEHLGPPAGLRIG